MKKMKINSPAMTIVLAVGIAAFAPSVAKAVPINGNITFTSGVQLDTSSVGTATEVTGWSNSKVTSSDGSFGGIAANTAVSLTAPWYFNTSTPFNLWIVGGFTFELISSWITYQNGPFVNVQGTGYIMDGNPADTTQMTWFFSASNPGAGSPATFSAQTSGSAVNDGASTAMLMGLSIMGIAAFSRVSKGGFKSVFKSMPKFKLPKFTRKFDGTPVGSEVLA